MSNPGLWERENNSSEGLDASSLTLNSHDTIISDVGNAIFTIPFSEPSYNCPIHGNTNAVMSLIIDEEETTFCMICLKDLLMQSLPLLSRSTLNETDPTPMVNNAIS